MMHVTDEPVAPLPSAVPNWRPIAALVVVALIGCVVFLTYPEIDLGAGRLFYEGSGEFVGQHATWIIALRVAFVVFFWACVLLAVIGLLRTRRPQTAWLGFAFPHWLFLAICLGVGPGLVANLVLKDQWGRARPKQVTEFGGSKAFTPPILMARECRRNCSFVSGEASSTYVPFFAAAVLMPQFALPLVAGGAVMGIAAGIVRMAQGGHFLSDVIFAGVFMALTVLVVQWLMFGPASSPGLRRRLAAALGREARTG